MSESDWLGVAAELPLPSAPVHFPLENELRARPDDEALWTVAADRWLEQGNRWAERVGARATSFPEENGLLRSAVQCLGLEVQWRMGFVRRATIRPACMRAGLSAEVVLAAVLTHPLSRFLEQLEVDGLQSFELSDHSQRAAREGLQAFLLRWLPPGVSSLEIGVSQLGGEGALEAFAAPLSRSIRQRYWLHGTMRIEPGGEVSPVFGSELDCQGLVRCGFESLRGGTHALRVLDEVEVLIDGCLRGGAGMMWFPGEALEVRGARLRFSEHTQTLLIVGSR